MLLVLATPSLRYRRRRALPPLTLQSRVSDGLLGYPFPLMTNEVYEWEFSTRKYRNVSANFEAAPVVYFPGQIEICPAAARYGSKHLASGEIRVRPAEGVVSRRVVGRGEIEDLQLAFRSSGAVGRSDKLWKARSRLYRSQILQVNMRLNSYLV